MKKQTTRKNKSMKIRPNRKKNIPADISKTVFHGQFSTTVTVFTFVYLHKVCVWPLTTLKLNFYWLI